MHLILAAIILFLFAGEVRAQSAAGSALQELASGGPYVAPNHFKQRFSGQFTLSEEDTRKPLTLLIHNGIGGAPGFNWIRVLIGQDMDLKGVGRAEEPSADLVYDESYIQRHTVSIDLSGKVFTGINTLIFETTAPKGASMSWFVEGPPSPEFAAINPTAAQSGGRLTLNGRGFSLDPGENRVTVNGHDAEILSATRTSLTVKVPKFMSAGSAQVVVTTNNVKSAPYTISIQMPQLEAAQ